MEETLISLERLENLAKQAVQGRFKGLNVTDVHVERVEDYEGYPILRVTIIFEGDPRVLDGKDSVSAMKRLFSKLRKEDGLPGGLPTLAFKQHSSAQNGLQSAPA